MVFTVWVLHCVVSFEGVEEWVASSTARSETPQPVQSPLPKLALSLRVNFSFFILSQLFQKSACPYSKAQGWRGILKYDKLRGECQVSVQV